MKAYVQCDSDRVKNKDSEELVNFLRNPPKDFFQKCFDKKLRQSMEDINHLKFSVFVVSDTAAGKSMLMNALLGRKLLFSQKGGGTAAATEILNNDDNCFRAVTYDENAAVIKKIDNPTYETMMELNVDEHIQKITMEGNIPFWNEKEIALTLTDTPDITNIKQQDYDKIIDKAVSGNDTHLILYVLDGTRIYDDMPLLKHIANKMKKGGKKVCSQILFVINKMDLFHPEEEDIQEVLLSAKKCLLSYGIENPQIIPCSAALALGVKNYFRHKEVKDLTKAQEKRLRWVARETLHLLNKTMEYENMHLEQYATLQADTLKQLQKSLSDAKEEKDIKMQALLHSGICSLEAAIVEHMEYYKKRKLKELVEAFYDYNRSFLETDPCEMLVTATMSAGKSTFINAITGKKVCLAQNMACTDKVQPIISKLLDVEVRLKYDDALTDNIDNEKKKAAKVVYFDGILGGQRVIMYDSPGVNYSGESKHKKITENVVKTGDYQLMIYLMNATQLGTNDDDEHLDYVKKYIGDRTILFVMNKVDAFNEEEEEIDTVVLKQVEYLKKKGFRNPLVCPVSAKAAFLAKKSQKESLSKLERRELNCMEDKFAQMKLVDYYQKYYPNIIIEDSEEEDIQLLKTCGISYVETIIKTKIKALSKGGSVNDTSIR